MVDASTQQPSERRRDWSHPGEDSTLTCERVDSYNLGVDRQPMPRAGGHDTKTLLSSNCLTDVAECSSGGALDFECRSLRIGPHVPAWRRRSDA